MTVQAFVSISFQADSAADVQALVDGMTLPDGAQVSASVNELVVQGVVAGGTVKPPDPLPSPPEAT